MSATARNPSPAAIVAAIAVAVLAIAAIVASFALDDWARAEILAGQGKGWKKSADYQMHGAISRYGDWPQLMIAGALGLFVAHKARSREWQRIIAAAMIASTLAGLLANASRLTTGRTRPRDSPKIEAGWHGPYHDGKLTIGNSKYNAFPSGHTATAVGFASVFLFARPLIGVLVMVAALAIAWSRMALGAHHLSDVVVAAILAMVVGWFTWRIARRDGDAIARWAISKLPKRKRPE